MSDRKGQWREHGRGMYSVELPPATPEEMQQTLEEWLSPEELKKLKQLQEECAKLAREGRSERQASEPSSQAGG